MKSSLILVCLAFTVSCFGQESNVMKQKEIFLDSLLANLRSAENDEEKKSFNAIFKDELETALKEPSAMSHSFTGLQTVGIIDSPDKKVRIVNWNVELDDLSHQYFCYILYQDDKKDEVRVTELQDISFGMPSQPTDIIDAENWYGALYYKIIPVEKGSRTMYTLLGWDYNSSLSQLKLIDVMYFTSGTVKLGNPIFKMGKETMNRVFFEHSKKSSMYLNYEASRERIMMDHLSPESPALKSFRSYYVPDMSYDAFEYEKNKWVLKEDVVGVNDGQLNSYKQEVQVMNEKTGKLETRVVKTNWQNPEDLSAPAGGSEHVAVTPETEAKETDENKAEKAYNPLDDRIDKKDKREPKNLSTVNGGKKKGFWKRRKKN